MNKSKRAGTEGENWWLNNLLVKVWPSAERRQGNTAYSDYNGTPVPVEAKRRKQLEIPLWTRRLQELHGDRWLLVVSPRDRRLKSAHPDMVIMSAPFALEVLLGWEASRHTDEHRPNTDTTS